MPISPLERGRRSFLRLTLLLLCALGSFGFACGPAEADPSGAPASPAPAAGGDISELRAQMQQIQAKLDLLESQQSQAAAMALEQRSKDAAAAEAAKAKKPPGAPVHIVETTGTDVRLYGLIEPTLVGVSNYSKSGASGIGIPVSWFSGNRWGLEVNQKLSTTGDLATHRTNST